MERVVIIGGGYAGIYALRELVKNKNIKITLIDKHTYHNLQPEVYDLIANKSNFADVTIDLTTLCLGFEHNYLEFKKWSLLNGYIPLQKLQIDRRDGNKNYSPINCRWVTPKVNQRNRKCVILSEEKAEEIRKLIAKNLKNKEIAKMYSVHEDTINDIRKGKTWN